MEPKDFIASSKRAWLLGLASLAVTLLSSVWFGMFFTAREQAWWNAIDWFLLYYGTAAILAVCGIRSIVGIWALLLSLLPLAVVCIFVFGR